MKHHVKMIVKYIFYGISWGCTFFTFFCLLTSIFGGEDYWRIMMKDFTRQALGAMFVGIGSASTSIIYQFEKPSEAVKRLIHFGVGMGIFYPTALYLGWIPFHPDKILHMIFSFLISCGIFMAIWFCFYLMNREEAKKINNRLRELEKDDKEEKN